MNIKKILKKFKRSYTQTDLYEAVYEEDIDFLKNNLKKTNIVYGGYSALNCAVSKNNIKMVKLLLEDDRIELTAKQYRVVFTACDHGFVEILKLFLEKVDRKKINFDLLKIAIKTKKMEIVKLILEDVNFNPFVEKMDWIDLALDIDFPECAFELVNNIYYDPSKNYNNDLNNAIIYKNVDLVKLIIKHKKCDPSHSNNVLIQKAYFENLNEIVDILFSHKKVRETLLYSNQEIYDELNKKKIKEKINQF